MSSFAPTPTSHGLFRGTVLVFAFVLACQAVWILAAEFSRLHLPANAQSATALPPSFGFIRGDIWAEHALAIFDLIQRDERNKSNAPISNKIEQAREVAARTLTIAPHDARIWLVLAAIELQFDRLNYNPAVALRMSYYTGANETDLFPLRLLLVVRANAIVDRDFQQLVRHDILTIVTRKQEMKPAILAAYREASPIGRQFLNATLEELDPTLLARFRSKE